MRVTQKDITWQNQLLDKVTELAGKRYTPELNIDLPINDAFDGLARNQNFYNQMRRLSGELRRQKRSVYPRKNESLLGIELLNFDYSFEEVLGEIESIKEYSTELIPWEKVEEGKKKLEKCKRDLEEKIRNVQNSPDNEKKDEHSEKIFSSELNDLYRLSSKLHQLDNLIYSDAAKLSNNKLLFLTGDTGIGKTHLLCDLVKKRFENNSFSYISLGQEFNNSSDIWKQLIKLNSDNRYRSKEKLLEKYDRLGEKSKSRFFIIIDALNETSTPSIWKKTLPLLIKEIKKYPNISLIVSVRNGFEDEIITASLKKTFHHIEHVGFKFKEWEAINKFFTEFGLPLPEIPLINPEFSVPLFLLLFCESRKNRSENRPNRQLFRGHEGSTSIFEDFIKGTSIDIADEFGLSSSSRVWNKVIKPLAEGMVSNRGPKDRIRETRAKSIINSELPQVLPSLILTSLTNHHLIIKVPRYSNKGKKTGYDYRFTYQRFSDHLIARYLMNKYANKRLNGSNTVSYFKDKLKRNGVIGRHFSDYSYRGVISALSIQVPERLDGEELINLCPHFTSLLNEAFLESIVWRNPSAFYLNKNGRPEKTIKIINENILAYEGGHSDFFATILNVAVVPDHPFSAIEIHNYLDNLGITSRDHYWSTFLHYDYGENGVVDRLLNWVFTKSFHNSVASPSKLLTGIILTWFFTSSNRSIRDKATKAMVILLSNDPETLYMLNQKFTNIDDPYVLERLYAVSYGVILRLSDYKHPKLNSLGKLIYKNIFSGNRTTNHLLIRDYAKNIIDVLVKHRAYQPTTPSKVSFELDTKWKRLPTIGTLEKKYLPSNFQWEAAQYEERGMQSIWNSFNGIGDFDRYIVDPAIRHWSKYKKGEKLPPTEQQVENKFKKTLSQEQKKVYEDIKSFNPFIRVISYMQKSDDEKAKKASEAEKVFTLQKKLFVKSLDKKQKSLYKAVIKANKTSRKTNSFNSGIAKRFILNRVFKLYDPKFHGKFDGMYASRHLDRQPATLERIGKKYQWIAFYELLGYLVDNFYYLEDEYSHKVGKYQGACKLYIRDIDPSCTVLSKPGYTNAPWKPTYNAWNEKISDDKWLRKKADLPKPEKFLIYKYSGKDWVLINNFLQWEQDIPPEKEKYHYPSRDLFYLFNGYFIRNKESHKLFKWLKNQNFYGRWMPEPGQGINEVFYREYPHSLNYKKLYSEYDNTKKGWISDVGRNKRMPGSIMEIGEEFSVTSASRDKSIEDSFNIGLPSVWLIKMMELKHSSTDGMWETRSGKVVIADLSVKLGGSSSLFIEKQFLMKFLKRNDLCLVWSLLGEKGILGGENGRLSGISGAYMLKNNGDVIGRIKRVSRN